MPNSSYWDRFKCVWPDQYWAFDIWALKKSDNNISALSNFFFSINTDSLIFPDWKTLQSVNMELFSGGRRGLVGQSVTGLMYPTCQDAG